jgi:hypothetical protein
MMRRRTAGEISKVGGPGLLLTFTGSELVENLMSSSVVPWRLAVIGGHFETKQRNDAQPIDSALVRDLGKLLDHDNHEHRHQMKEMMRNKIYIP